jgi:twinkle protein
MSLYAGQPFSKGPTLRMDRETVRQAREFIRDKFFMVLPEEPTLDAVTEKFLFTHRKHGVGGLLLDPWNEMEHNRPAHMSETEWCNQELRKLKRIGWNYDVWIALVTHTTKMYRNKQDGKFPVPTLYDINGSAAFFNKADNGLVIVRDKGDEYAPVEVHVQKVRFQEIGGLTADRPALFRHDKVTGQYREVTTC